eukprot:11545964-Prorocentrum_lima.AAC.1
MTSSLVGSEMCIRDSPQTDMPIRTDRIERPEPEPRWEPFDVAAFPTEPVSYTHLTLPTICSV